jgi:hypothetical protein
MPLPTRLPLPQDDPALLFCKEQIDDAIARHRLQPTEANLLRVADVSRDALNIGSGIARSRGFDSIEFHHLYEHGTDYTRPRWFGKQTAQQPQLPNPQLFIDVVYEVQREVREHRDTLAEILALLSKRTAKKLALRKEAA